MKTFHPLFALLVAASLAFASPGLAAPSETPTPDSHILADVTDAFSIPAMGTTVKVRIRQGELKVGDLVSVHHDEGVVSGVRVTRVDPALQDGQTGFVGTTLDSALVYGLKGGAVVASPSTLTSTRKLRADVRMFRTGAPASSGPARAEEIAEMAKASNKDERIQIQAGGDRPRTFSTGFTPEVQFHAYTYKAQFTFPVSDPVIGGPTVPAEVELPRFEATRVGARFRIDAFGGVVGEGVVTEVLD